MKLAEIQGKRDLRDQSRKGAAVARVWISKGTVGTVSALYHGRSKKAGLLTAGLRDNGGSGGGAVFGGETAAPQPDAREGGEGKRPEENPFNKTTTPEGKKC